ncbi:hypothetical protein GCM10023189_60810 [Nibrella saemangeumensis]|uniref:ER-bound oxygenase mpaB/mpaB'/Rubber oxygenase catalytic domain-containing protein n=1 Tax=Nibrella saemangeumensis TaxID=1084526 RepID=A0ABP8NT78_9BACT
MSTYTWTDEYLWRQRLVGDPPADSVIATLLARNQKGEIDQIFQMLVRNRDFPNPAFDALPDDVKNVVEDYFLATRTLPDWAEPFKLMVAADVFRQYGPKILLVLLCKSLPLCYTGWRGAKVLYQTGRMHVHDGSPNSFTRRVMETAQFVVNIMQHNSFEHDGKAVLTIQKVRLMHAAIRYFAQERGWDTQTYGVPINQEDLTGTLLSFTVVIVDGLKQLGINLTPEESEAYFHLWRVVGYLMGVDDELNSEDEAACRFLMNAIIEQQAGPSKEGTELTAACIDMMDSRLSFGRRRNISHVFVRFFIGDHFADMLEVPPYEEESINLEAVQWLDRQMQGMTGRNGLIAAMGRSFSSGIINMVLNFHNASKNELFRLPSALADSWQNIEPDFRIPPVLDINEALFYFDKLTRHFKAQNNPMGLFTAVYQLVTERVAEGIRLGLFEHSDMMEEVDVRFCSLYFNAVNHYFDGTPAKAPWQVSFDAARRPLVANQHIFSACNAHISFDLPQVVSELFPGEKVHLFYNDFLKMNELFGDMYNQMNDSMARVFRPFGTVLKYLDEQVIATEHALMRQGRDNAWKASVRLAGAVSDEERRRLIAELEQESAALGRKLVNPPWPLNWTLQLIARNEAGTVAQKIDVMLRSALLPAVS